MTTHLNRKVWLCGAVGVLALDNLTNSGEPHGDCLGLPGSCCEYRNTPGCEEPFCCGSVCYVDTFCCTDAWDSQCVAGAVAYCGLLCTGGCPGEGECCTAHDQAGCRNEGCCSTVCEHLPSCCILGWDETCVGAADRYCLDICGCDRFGDLNADGAVDLRDVAVFQVCFAGQSTPIASGCACGDFNADNDVDLADYSAFFELLGGP